MYSDSGIARVNFWRGGQKKKSGRENSGGRQKNVFYRNSSLIGLSTKKVLQE